MKQKLFKLALLFTAVLAFSACSNDDNSPIIEPPYYGYHYAYVVNNGNWNKNDGTVASLDSVNKTWTVNDLYKQANGSGIGDAQDLVLVDGKIFVTSTTSSKIEVLDKDGKLLSRVAMPNKSPRYIAQYGGNVYFTAYSGYVYKMNVNSYQLTDSVQVGDHPEALAVATGKIYVAISGYGKGKSLAVVDIKTFKKTKEIETALNPYNQMIATADGSKVYFVACLDHSDHLLQCVDTKTDAVKTVEHASSIAQDKNVNSLVCIYAPYGKNGNVPAKKYFRFNMENNSTTEIKGLADVPNPGQVSVDWKTGNIYVVNNDYSGPCQLYVFDSTGKQLRKLTSGTGTMQVVFAKE